MTARSKTIQTQTLMMMRANRIFVFTTRAMEMKIRSATTMQTVRIVDGVVWGPPWSDCVQSRFAVLRCEIGEVPNYGICVVKVTRKDAEVLSGQYPVRTLEGKEYLCTRSNIDVGCVRLGKWNWHSTRSTTDDYDNSSVIKYFDRLNDGALPIDVMRAVESSHAKKTIFR